MKFKSLFIAAAAALVLSAPLALRATTPLCLHLTTGERIQFTFENKPVLTFGDKNAVTIKDATKQISTNEFTKVRKLTFDNPTAISDIEAGAQATIARDDVDSFTLYGFKPGTVVTVTALNGVHVFSLTIADDQPCTISLSDLAAGVYIISADSVTCKVAIN